VIGENANPCAGPTAILRSLKLYSRDITIDGNLETRDSAILSAAEKGKETERSTGNSSLFLRPRRAASHLGAASS